MIAPIREQLARAGDDVQGFLGRIGVPTEMPAGLDLVDDGGLLRGTLPAAGREGTGPVNGLVHGPERGHV